MSKIKNTSFIFLIVLFLLSFSNLMAQDTENLTGIVKAVEWDDDGNVIGAALVMDVEEENEDGDVEVISVEYLIKDNAVGKKLFANEGKAVEVSAVVSEDDEGIFYINVKSFKVLEKNEPDSEVEEPDEPNELDEPDEPME